MVPRLPFFLLLICLVQDSDSNSSTSPPPPPPPSLLSDPSWVLGLRLYQALRSDSNTINTLFSPLLIASSLTALGEGSAGSTASQVRDLLKSPSQNEAQVEKLLSGALRSFTESNGTSFHLHVSSAVFSKQKVSKVFAERSHSKFQLQQETLKQGKSQTDLKQISDWAKGVLRGQEGTTFQGEIKAEAGALILANALRFKGLWEREFSEESADRRTFLGKKYTKVAMLHRAGLYRFYEDINNMVQVLEVPLWEGKASLLLLLPFHVENLARLEKLLTLELMSKWLEKANVTSVAISLPRANISSTLSLQKQLSALGLTNAWDQKAADFSGVSDGGKVKLHLGDVLHWASMELAPEAGDGELEEEVVAKPKLFYADHPFIILVRDNRSGALLLMGALDHAEGEAVHDEL